MEHKLTLTITSLLSILFMSFHLADEVARGLESGKLSTQVGVLILVVWLYGTLALPGRRSGYVILLLGAIFGSGVPVLHMTGAGLAGGRIAGTSGVPFWVWTLYAMGATANLSLILSIRALWRMRSSQLRQA
jgi:hypothetical protein